MPVSRCGSFARIAPTPSAVWPGPMHQAFDPRPGLISSGTACLCLAIFRMTSVAFLCHPATVGGQPSGMELLTNHSEAIPSPSAWISACFTIGP